MKKKPAYFNWTLDEWEKFYEHQVNVHFTQTADIEITTRCHNTKRDPVEYNAYVMDAGFEFKFLGYTFVSHRCPDPEAYIENELPFGDWHISELHTGFMCAFGQTRDSARASARKILIHNAAGLRSALDKAHGIIGVHQWNFKKLTDAKNRLN